MSDIDYAPRNVLNHMRDGWRLITTGGGRRILRSPQNDREIFINPRVFAVLVRQGLIERGDAPTFRLTSAGQAAAAGDGEGQGQTP